MSSRFCWMIPSLAPSLVGTAALLWSHAVAAAPSAAGHIPGGGAGTGLKGSVLLDARTATYIPPALNPGFVDWAGRELAIRTRVHDVKFMVGIKRSDEQGGISDVVPPPLLKNVNGVEFYEDNLLLSGRGFHGEIPDSLSSPYSHYVFGPIDADGLVQGDNPDSPRYGLGYMPVSVLVPKGVWNGRLVVYFHCGGEGPTLHRAIIYPFLYPFDEIRLLEQGYAVATMALFVVPKQQNHNAPDGSFWEAFSSPEKSRFMAHNADIDAAGHEQRIRADLDSDVLMTADATLARNVVNVVKNLLRLRRGHYPRFTYATAYSYGGRTISALDSGRDAARVAPALHPELLVGGMTPFNGGNFAINDWTGIDKHDRRRSLLTRYGRVIDGFFTESGVVEYPDQFAAAKDPDYPLTTKTMHVAGDFEMTMVNMGPMLAMREIARKLPNAHPSLARSLDAWQRVYFLEMTGHARYDFFFDMGRNGGRSLFFDRSVLFDQDGSYRWFTGGDAGLNRAGRGERYRWFYEKLGDYDNADFVARYVHLFDLPGFGPFGCAEYIASSPRTFPVRAQLFANLVRWVEEGVTPPPSHIGSHIMSSPHYLPGEQKAPGVWSGVPECPAGCPYPDDSACPTTDCYYTAILPGYGPPLPISDAAREAISYVRDNRLIDYVPQSIAAPDVAARTSSYVVLIPDFSWAKPYDDNHLRALYGDHEGYVRAVWQSYFDLRRQRLIDPVLGWRLVSEAAQSSVLADGAP